MDVLLSTSLGASSEDMGEHGALVAAVANAMAAQQTGSALNALTTRVLFCELTSSLVLLYYCIFLLANFPWLLPFIRYFNQKSPYGLSWQYMEVTAKKLVQERRSHGNKGKVHLTVSSVTVVQASAFSGDLTAEMKVILVF